MKEKLIIKKKSLKGEDGYKTFSIRIKDETVDRLTTLSQKTNRSRNELINILIGDMSIVGPRPLAVVYLPYYTDEERRKRNCCK